MHIIHNDYKLKILIIIQEISLELNYASQVVEHFSSLYIYSKPYNLVLLFWINKTFHKICVYNFNAYYGGGKSTIVQPETHKYTCI